VKLYVGLYVGLCVTYSQRQPRTYGPGLSPFGISTRSTISITGLALDPSVMPVHILMRKREFF
jgi:hypothetical protein